MACAILGIEPLGLEHDICKVPKFPVLSNFDRLRTPTKWTVLSRPFGMPMIILNPLASFLVALNLNCDYMQKSTKPTVKVDPPFKGSLVRGYARYRQCKLCHLGQGWIRESVSAKTDFHFLFEYNY